MNLEDKMKIEPEFNRALELRETRPGEAIKILKKLNDEFPNQPSITGVLGGIYHALKDWPATLYYYQQTVRLSPGSELASLGLFHALWHHERFYDAFEESKRFIKLKGLTENYTSLMDELDEAGIFH